MKKGDVTKLKILDAGLKLWPDDSVIAICAKLNKMSRPALNYHFKGDKLKDAVATHAVATGNSRVIAQLVATKHKAVRNMSAEEKSQHMTLAS